MRRQLSVPTGDRGYAGWAPWARVLAWGLPELVIIAILSQVAREGLPVFCDENVRAGTNREAGCDFLERGGYTAIGIAPSVLMVSAMLLAARLRRLSMVHLGFALVLVLVVLSAAVSPSDYPWVEGTQR